MPPAVFAACCGYNGYMYSGYPWEVNASTYLIILYTAVKTFFRLSGYKKDKDFLLACGGYAVVSWFLLTVTQAYFFIIEIMLGIVNGKTNTAANNMVLALAAVGINLLTEVIAARVQASAVAMPRKTTEKRLAALVKSTIVYTAVTIGVASAVIVVFTLYIHFKPQAF